MKINLEIQSKFMSLFLLSKVHIHDCHARYIQQTYFVCFCYTRLCKRVNYDSKTCIRRKHTKHSMLEDSSNLPQCSLRSFGSSAVYAITIAPYTKAT
jgi:hypothetical protein